MDFVPAEVRRCGTICGGLALPIEIHILKFQSLGPVSFPRHKIHGQVMSNSRNWGFKDVATAQKVKPSQFSEKDQDGQGREMKTSCSK